ncbi:SURF1 family cytochrome oxidase biogenesis protein [Arthrobacter sp. 260]|uniref:SURF1 family cytochrome oxidase biogenesis protein n=1 Tax=Arthrobacter sp. 260 TaxID=2735314 RepID=UPI00149210F4|nr:SURF1 family protein [Arthrobacter sp. 260]
MLKTALKPRWILSLILAMVIAAVFVLLSQWQFSSSTGDAPPPESTTERERALTDVFSPGVPMTAPVADQMVTMDGEFLPDTTVLVQDRLQGDRQGFWLISAFAVDGVPEGAVDDPAGPPVIPVVHGWIPDAQAAAEVPEPVGSASVVGRLLPAEGPVAERPVAGQIPTLATAELTNRWDRPIYAGFVVSTATEVGGLDWAPEAPLEVVTVGPQPQETPLNWLNIFYAVEWFVFAGFAFFLWWRLVADDYRRTLEEAEDSAAEAANTNDDDSDDGSTGHPDPAVQGPTTSEARQ